MKISVKGRLFGAIFAALLAAFTAYALLDVFVIPHTYAAVEAQPSGAVTDQAASSGSVTEAPAGATTDAYSDENITITLTEYREHDTTIYVADVTLSSPEYLKTALASDVYGRNIKADTSEIAAAHNAILAINGDFYGARNSGYVIRGGTLYRDRSGGNEDLVVYADGSFGIISEDEITAAELLESGAVEVLSFGPGLVENGEITVSENDEVGRAMASNPRTAIGIIDENRYLFVVSDGRTESSEGLTLYQLAEFMRKLGAKTAYNLDGGGSSTMFFNGEVVNNPTTGGNRVDERSVSDIVYIGY